jgi:polyhydroxyalkanoate synthase subunit PhaC
VGQQKKAQKASGTQRTPRQLTAADILQELVQVSQKLMVGAKRLSELTEDELAIATAPKEEILRSDMVRLYRYQPVVAEPARTPVLIVYALVGSFHMVDLEADRSFVRKLLGNGLDVYVVDWGMPKRAQQWLDIADYVDGYLDECVEAIRERHGVPAVNLLGICQGGVFTTCYAALYPEKVKNLILTVTPLDFHGDVGNRERGAGYVNLWARALSPEDVDAIVDAFGSIPGTMGGFSFLMMNPVANLTKYTTELVDLLDNDKKLLNFLHMERWIAERPDHPGGVLRQWFKDLYQGNKLIKGELELDGRRVDLANVSMPVLNVYATGDVIVPPACSTGVGPHVGTKDYTEIAVPGGHIGTFVGAKAQQTLVPAIVDWLKARL